MTGPGDPDCADCGAPGCQAAFEAVAAQEFADQAFFRAHRLTVDAYCLQHPDVYMKSSKSAAAHLAGMCWSLEHGRATHLPDVLKRWVDGARTYPRVDPPPPRHRGALTVRHVLGIEDPVLYEQRALEWARSAWQAWAPHHGQARAWVADALAERKHTR
jgi:hypothetical protein